jgi:hypothetical protein
MARRTTINKYAHNSFTVKFFDGRVRVAELTFGNNEDAERVADIWSTSMPDNKQKAEPLPGSYTLF